MAPPYLWSDLHFDPSRGPSHSSLPPAQHWPPGFPGWCSLLSPLSETFLPSFLSPTKAGCVPILSFRPGARRRERHVNETLVCGWGAVWGWGPLGPFCPWPGSLSQGPWGWRRWAPRPVYVLSSTGVATGRGLSGAERWGWCLCKGRQGRGQREGLHCEACQGTGGGSAAGLV